jgi:AcrR family transcriptional regulator
LTEALRKPTRRGLVESELLEQAAVLFAERGFSGTTLQDVADTLGLTRAALYHYFESKEAMLAALIEGITITRASQLRKLRLDERLSQAEKLTAITRMMVVNVVSQAARFRLLLQSERELPAGLAEKHAAARRETLAQIVQLFEEGIADGNFKPADPHVAAFALLGMCNWTAWWYKPEQNGSAEAIGDQLAEFALAAFVRPPESSAPELGEARRALRKVREELAAVERAIGPP